VLAEWYCPADRRRTAALLLVWTERATAKKGDMSQEIRSQRACPVCGKHSLALDEAPRIDIMGVQPYSDLLGMGDLHQESMGIVCLECGTRWRSKEALDQNDPEPADDDPDPPPEDWSDHEDAS